MTDSASATARPRPIAPLLWLGMGLSCLLGIIAGSAFFWASTPRAWSIFLAGFLWTLIVATVTALVRLVRERVHRGEWGRGTWLGCQMTFPLTTLYLAFTLVLAALAPTPAEAAPATRPEVLTVAPLCYGATLVVAVFVGPLFVLTSPFRR